MIVLFLVNICSARWNYLQSISSRSSSFWFVGVNELSNPTVAKRLVSGGKAHCSSCSDGQMFVDSFRTEQFRTLLMAGIDSVEPGGSTALLGDDLEFRKMDTDPSLA